MTRKEHMDWCKQRALEILETGDIVGAWGSMVSDLGKHEATANHIAIGLGNELLLAKQLDKPEEMRKFIEGFN